MNTKYVLTRECHSPDCDVNDHNPDGIIKPCNCGALKRARAVDVALTNANYAAQIHAEDRYGPEDDLIVLAAEVLRLRGRESELLAAMTPPETPDCNRDALPKDILAGYAAELWGIQRQMVRGWGIHLNGHVPTFLKALCELLMCSDPWPASPASEIEVKSKADEMARELGFSDWVDAYLGSASPSVRQIISAGERWSDHPIPIQAKDIWECGCGEVNGVNLPVCARCGRNRGSKI